MISMRRSSGTRPPFSMIGPALRPVGVPAEMASRNMSPVEIFGTFRCATSRAACVPLPARGGPRKMTRTRRGMARDCGLAAATDAPPLARSREPVVVAHDELRLNLGHRVHGHADDDEQRGAAEIEVQAQPFR